MFRIIYLKNLHHIINQRHANKLNLKKKEL